MDSKKLIWLIPVVSALVLAVAVGSLAVSSSLAADSDPVSLTEKDGSQMRPWIGEPGSLGHGGRLGFKTEFDYDAFIAEELGVTVEELQNARQAAHEAALDQAVEEGVITEEQAELIKARDALRQYIDPQELLSKALGIDIDEIEAAQESGQPLQELFGDLEPEEIRQAMQSAYEDAVQQAIDENVITASQAEQLQEEGFPGRFFGKPFRGAHRNGGHPFAEPPTDADGDL